MTMTANKGFLQTVTFPGMDMDLQQELFQELPYLLIGNSHLVQLACFAEIQIGYRLPK